MARELPILWSGHPDVIAIGASAGGLAAIVALIRHLPPDLPASVLVVLHRSAEKASHLCQILARSTPLHVAIAHGGERLRRGVCLIGEPSRHLTLGPDMRVHLLPDGFYRSHNIDALFSSLARHAGHRTIGIVLSGLLKDGTLGLKAIKEAGGIALVQSPKEAEYPDMPRSAIEHDGRIDLVAPVNDLAGEICRLIGRSTVPVEAID